MNDQILEAFQIEAEGAQRVIDDLDEADFGRPTNCPPWNVKELIVHMAMCLPPPGAPPQATTEATLNEPADYYRRPERGTAEYHQQIAEAAQEAAVELAGGAAAATLFRQRWRATFDAWTTSDLQRVVQPSAGAIRLSDYIVTRVISNAAHGLDLAISLDRVPWTTRSALGLMRPVFLSLLGGPPPDDLGWDDQAFFAHATGRQVLTPADRARLGARASAFPLLS